jgi:hypothetical protein
VADEEGAGDVEEGGEQAVSAVSASGVIDDTERRLFL